MKQVRRKNIMKKYPEKKVRVKKEKVGTSKLEKKFAEVFLNKLNVKYVYQFKAESIGRFYDFFLPELRMLIEVDGDYYHSRGLTYEQMNPMQKKNSRVDRLKDEWAMYNGIPLLRISEFDINKNPSKVMKILKEEIKSVDKENKRIKNRKNP